MDLNLFKRNLEYKKRLIEGRLHRRVSDGLDKLMVDIQMGLNRTASNKQNIEEMFNSGAEQLDLIEKSVCALFPTPSTNPSQPLSLVQNPPFSFVQMNKQIQQEAVEDEIELLDIVGPMAIPQTSTPSQNEPSSDSHKEMTDDEDIVLVDIVPPMANTQTRAQPQIESTAPLVIVTVTPDGAEIKEEQTEDSTERLIQLPTQQVIEQMNTVPVRISNSELQANPLNLARALSIEAPTRRSNRQAPKRSFPFSPDNLSQRKSQRLTGQVQPNPQQIAQQPTPPVRQIREASPVPVVPNRRRYSRKEPIFCTECAKPFIRNYELVKHMRVHTGAKPYRCTWENCNFAGNDRSNMVRHVRVKHLNLPSSKKLQKEKNIVDDREEQDYFIMVGPNQVD